MICCIQAQVVTNVCYFTSVDGFWVGDQLAKIRCGRSRPYRGVRRLQYRLDIHWLPGCSSIAVGFGAKFARLTACLQRSWTVPGSCAPWFVSWANVGTQIETHSTCRCQMYPRINAFLPAALPALSRSIPGRRSSLPRRATMGLIEASGRRSLGVLGAASKLTVWGPVLALQLESGGL